MKPFIQTFLFFFISIRCGFAQDSLVLLSPKMFQDAQRISLSGLDGWIYKQGNDSSWAKMEVNPYEWTKLKPTELSSKYLDKTGKVEGWFRFRFKLGNDFGDMPLGLRRGAWAATDIYVDGKFVASFGNTGMYGKDFREYNPIDKQSTPINLEKGKEHLIAIHFVDYLSSFPPRRLKSAKSDLVRRETMGLESLLMLTGPKYDIDTLSNSRNTLFFRSVWLSVTAVLSLLFWQLFVLNRGERKILSLIATYFTISALSNLTRFFLTDRDISFAAWQANSVLQGLCAWIIIVITFIITATILNFKMSRYFTRLLILYSVFGVISVLFDFAVLRWANIVIASITIGIILISRWKKLNGSQWAIAWGLGLSMVFIGLLLVVPLLLSKDPRSLILLTCFYFSFPLSLVAYVAMRFREIISEVQGHALRVVQMTEEKKEQAVKQQKLLEEEVARQTAELRTALENLRSTQAQLIQQEKMASLGELTAGIAHEIQNPLNFVNNFSEVNKELIEELKSEKSKMKGERDEALEDELLNNIADNEGKIIHHGKRADAIVKGMLQHSRASSGQKEPTDINALADEYLRLAYHGLRAKDKSFNAKVETNFDHSILKINVVPQDIGRVLLNLINNAFYAVSEKKQHLDGSYEPTVSVTTRKLENKIEIKVKDNGDGISQKILDKIFQPFFTTKPTGVGTGLGLSLSYDIVKAHGGEIKVRTEDREGTDFILTLPAQV